PTPPSPPSPPQAATSPTIGRISSMHLPAKWPHTEVAQRRSKQNAPASVGRGFAFLAPDPRLSSKAGSLGRRQATWLPRCPLQAGPGIQLRDSAGLLPASLLAPALETATRPPPKGRGAPASSLFDFRPQYISSPSGRQRQRTRPLLAPRSTVDHHILVDTGLEGKAALVGGASRGIGRAIALGLAREGA